MVSVVGLTLIKHFINVNLRTERLNNTRICVKKLNFDLLCYDGTFTGVRLHRVRWEGNVGGGGC